jgi:deoxycytidine triphosphate deaminase
MQLSEREILDLYASRELVIFGPKASLPFEPAVQVRPASVDLRLDSRIWAYAPKAEALDVSRPEDWRGDVEVQVLEPGAPIVIPAHGLVHGQIYEQLKLPDTVAGRIAARSRTARLGLAVHCSGDFINPGFRGAMPLQLVNHNPYPVTLYPYMSLCQLVLYRLGAPPLRPYAGRPSTAYHDQSEARPSVLNQDAALQGERDRTLKEEEERQLVEDYLAERRRAVPAPISLADDPFTPRGADRPPPLVIQAQRIERLTVGTAYEQVRDQAHAGITALAQGPDGAAVAEALRTIVRFVEEHRRDLGEPSATVALEQAQELAGQAALPAEKRGSAGALKGSLATLKDVLSTVKTGADLAEKLWPVISQYFGWALPPPAG